MALAQYDTDALGDKHNLNAWLVAHYDGIITPSELAFLEAQLLQLPPLNTPGNPQNVHGRSIIRAAHLDTILRDCSGTTAGTFFEMLAGGIPGSAAATPLLNLMTPGRQWQVVGGTLDLESQLPWGGGPERSDCKFTRYGLQSLWSDVTVGGVLMGYALSQQSTPSQQVSRC